MSQYRVAVVGATGAVGTVMRAKLKERGFPAETIVPFASERSEGRELDGVPCRVLSDESIQGFDIALFSRGRDDLARVGAEVRRRRRGRRRQLERLPPRPRDPARGLRGQPGRARGPPRPDREPELLDDAADGRAEADPRRGRHRPPDRLDLPVGLRHRRQGGQGARGPDPRRAGRRGAPGPHDLPAPHRVQRAGRRRELPRRRRPHRRRAQDDVRDAQDPRRREHQDRRHVRARAGAQRALGVGLARDEVATSASRTPARCWRTSPG